MACEVLSGTLWTRSDQQPRYAVAVTIAPGVAAGHPVTAQAGADVLMAGGHAVDAAVAMMLVSCAAETLFTGLGGGGYATVYDAETRSTHCVDFFVSVPGLGGRRAGAGTPIEIIFVGQAMPYEIGASTVAVPGVPAGAHYLWRRWGRMPWRDVVAPGRAASLGTAFPQAHADLLPRVVPAMVVGDGVKVYRRPDGSLLQAGDRLCHPDHVHAFDLLAEQPEDFYRGDYAAALVAACADSAALDAEDLSRYAVVESAPRQAAFGGYTVLARGDDLDDVLNAIAAAASWMHGDPRHEPDTACGLVTALQGSDRRAETTNLCAVDPAGNACVITTSLGLGSGVWVPGFGVHLNSMLGEGELIRGVLVPGTRLGSMMSPLVAVDAENRPVVAAGAAGGSRIRPALVQSVLRMLNGEDPQTAIDQPRLNALPGLVRVEPGFSQEVLAALRAAGNEVVEAERLDPYFGGVSALAHHGGGADPRRSGAVLMLG